MYKIALTQVTFDNTYSNVLRFDDLAQQKAYFKLDTLFSNQPEVNYPFGTFYVTRVPIKIRGTDPAEMLSYNYAIVKDMSKEDVYYYYFVNSATYDSGNTQIIADLELDVFNTYYLSTKFSHCLINRAHLDRWGAVTDGKVSFDNSVNSKLYMQEDIQPVAKYLANRKEIDLIDKLSNSEVKRIIKEKVKGWVYMFLDPNFTNNDEVKNVTAYLNNTHGYKLDNIAQNYKCFVFPICDDTTFLIDSQGLKDVYNPWTFNVMQRGQTLTPQDSIINYFAPYIIDMIVSQQPPLSIFTDDNYVITTENDTIKIQYLSTTLAETYNDMCTSLGYFNLGNVITGSKKYGAVSVNNYVIDYRSYQQHTSIYNFTFDVADIVSNNHNKEYNPKLIGMPYRELRLGYANGEPYKYDPLKVGSNFYTKTLNNIAPAIYKGYVAIYNNTNGIYSDNTVRSYVGCKLSLDASIPYSLDQLKQYLAQNKNFYQMAQNRMIGTAVRSVLSASPGGIVTAKLSYENEMLSLDNMDNAPETFKNLDSAVFLNNNINSLKPYIEYWEALPAELKISDDYMNRNGFTYNQIDNVKNCDNIRKYWNYVQAQIENVVSDKIISNNVRDKFKTIFARGVRFWNITDLVTSGSYDYDIHENYERRLDNE